MKTFFRFVVVLLWCATAAVARLSKSMFRKDVHVLMYETDSSLEKDPRSPLHFFKERSNIAKLQTTVFGGDLAYHGFGDKYQTLRPLLELLDKSKLVILADARDVALNVPEDPEAASRAVDHFMETYHKLTKNAPNAIVMSAESQCCVSAMSHAHPGDYFDTQTMKRHKRACASGTQQCLWDENKNIYSWVEFMYERAFNDTGIDYIGDVYLNAGLMAGYPADLMKLLDTIDIGPSEDDQAVLSGLMYSFPELIVLDYDQEMFGNNQWPRGLEAGCVFETGQATSRLMHRETGTEPLIVHTPGKFYGCLDVLIEELGGNSQQRYLETHPNGNPRRTGESERARRRLGKEEEEDEDVKKKDSKKGVKGSEAEKDGSKTNPTLPEVGDLEETVDEKDKDDKDDDKTKKDKKDGGKVVEDTTEELVDDIQEALEESDESANYGPGYGQYGLSPYGLYGNYGNYGYGNYGSYGNYGNYGYGNYGYGSLQDVDVIGRRRRVRQAFREPRTSL
ncbi:hypothetical protein IV203_037270 [Nitzschia inconspicua]|uniref:Uncharacterized protein n=1 Tax=Nitzschia inconspicua TaxID=303405 RepID=A0A9K3LLV0_9STRA|nr:hypothetical protein IV203_037270 [Nitzschia inconspicua]